MKVKKILALLLTIAMVMTVLPCVAGAWGINWGGQTTTTTTETKTNVKTGTVDEIVTNKVATETTDGSIKDEYGNIIQTYDVDLSVKGKMVYPGAACDIVLAIDLSNSMTNDGSKNLEITKKAATNFIEKVLLDANTNARIAIVSYGTYARAYNFSTKSWDPYGATVTADQYYTTNKDTAKAVISDKNFKPAALAPTKPKDATSKNPKYTEYESGGTNTESAYRTAKAVTDTRNRPEASSFVVFMTDGLPTYAGGIATTKKGTWGKTTTTYEKVTGDGSKTTAAIFNGATAAGKELKAAGNDIYNVALLDNIKEGTNDYNVAAALLSSRASYKASGEKEALTFEEDGEAFAKSYIVLNDSNKDTAIDNIYISLTYRCYALATGVVTDTIPAGFALTDASKEDLLDQGVSVKENADGSTTLVFTDVVATDTVYNLPVYSIVSTGACGATYTNSSATFNGELYDGTKAVVDFPMPIAGILPKTVDDEDATTVNTKITIDITANDFIAEKLNEGYKTSDFTFVITDENGNAKEYTDFSAVLKDGKVEFSAPAADVYNFYYVVKFNVKDTDKAYAVNNDKELVSRPTKVTVTVTAPTEPEKPEEPEVKPEEKPEAKDESIKLKGVHYAYIFGYEPILETKDGETTAIIYMAMDDYVTREQVSAMVIRMLDQNDDTAANDYPLYPSIEAHAGQWYERGLAYMCSVGGLDKNEPVSIGPVTRGEVAKLIACGLNLNLSEETPFDDIELSPYKEYIEKVYKYKYMNGMSDGSFAPEKYMTRAEFCSLFNNIIGRNKCGLKALNADGEEFTVTAETYYFVDMDPSHWAYEICLKASSAYDAKGYVDLDTRLANIRNILDRYDSQKKF